MHAIHLRQSDTFFNQGVGKILNYKTDRVPGPTVLELLMPIGLCGAAKTQVPPKHKRDARKKTATTYPMQRKELCVVEKCLQDCR